MNLVVCEREICGKARFLLHRKLKQSTNFDDVRTVNGGHATTRDYFQPYLKFYYQNNNAKNLFN